MTTPISSADTAATVPIQNPSFDVDTAGWTLSAGLTFARDTTLYDTLPASGQITWPTAAIYAAYVNHSTGTVFVVGGRYTASVRVNSAVGAPPMLFQSQPVPLTGPTTESSGSVADGTWQTLTVSFVATHTVYLFVLYNNAATTAGQIGNLDTVQVVVHAVEASTLVAAVAADQAAFGVDVAS